METNKIEKVTPRGSQNIVLHEISEKYSVVFYTISRYIVFQYCWDDGIDFYATSRDIMFSFGFLRKKKKNCLPSSVKKRKNFKRVWYIAHHEMMTKKIR